MGTGTVMVGLAAGLTNVGIGVCFLGGIIAIVGGCEVLNEHIAEWN